MTYVLGVDGGNFKTRAAVADMSGRILGVGRAGNSNHQGLGIEAALAEVRRSCDGALRIGGVDTSEVSMAYFSLSGADLPYDFALLRPALEAQGLARTIVLTNDTIAALLAGSESPNAVVVIAGAGTNAAGRNAAGEEIRLPGLGWQSGDWGGGGELAREAIRLVCRAWDGRGERTVLESMVTSAAGVPDVEALIEALYLRTVPRDYLPSLPPLIFRAAEAGDDVAISLIRRQGKEVAKTAATILRRLGILQVPSEVVLAGSIFRGSGSLLMDTIRHDLRPVAPFARLIRPDTDPVVGAVLGALNAIGLEVDATVRRRAEESYAAIVHSEDISCAN